MTFQPEQAWRQRIAELEAEVAALRQELAQYRQEAPDVSLDADDLAARKAFVGFDEDTAAQLAALRPFMEREVDGLVEAFYVHLRRFAPTRQYLEDPQVLARLRAAQTAYLLSLTQGVYDEAYARQRLRLGQTHFRIQLTPRWFLGAYAVLFDLIVSRLQAHYAGQPERLLAAARALCKAFILDMQLAVQAYIDAYQAQLRQANAALQQHSEELERRVAKRTEEVLQSGKLAAIGELAAGIAHEINNPINGIMNYAEIIAEELPEEHKLGAYAREIVFEAQRIAEIVRELLAFARQDTQEHSPANLADILDASLTLIGRHLEKDGITIRREYSHDLPKIKCRSQLIQQVVLNLLSNAHHALNARYPTYDPNKIVRIRTRLIRKGGRPYVRLSVRDHGIGIDPANRARIFEPFFTTKRHQGGTGLGLSVSYGIIAEHQGTMSVDSVPGEYTQFDVDLPVDNGWETIEGLESDAAASGGG
ncbi:MAG: hypothetical protein KatS3mg131_3633 [Candidatus Tectimicrobiota bacterium]|nr:MAG: hypothetical protein KatS3mg131_3633 [Candidatus Tectomicrobia bacterium]